MDCVKIVHLLFLESKFSFRESEFEVPTFPWNVENPRTLYWDVKSMVIHENRKPL